MDKTRQLFVRGCKHSTRRVYSVYRRFYSNSLDKKDEHREIAGLLQVICDDLDLANYKVIICSLHPESHWFEDTEDYWEVVVKIFCSIIRTTPINKLNGLTSPLRFRT